MEDKATLQYVKYMLGRDILESNIRSAIIWMIDKSERL